MRLGFPKEARLRLETSRWWSWNESRQHDLFAYLGLISCKGEALQLVVPKEANEGEAHQACRNTLHTIQL